jgi:hypothetical protein
MHCSILLLLLMHAALRSECTTVHLSGIGAERYCSAGKNMLNYNKAAAELLHTYSVGNLPANIMTAHPINE